MATLIAFITANAGLILGVASALINLFVAIFAKNERVTGILAIIRGILERVSALQPKNSDGTLKLPGAKPGPKVPTPVMRDR